MPTRHDGNLAKEWQHLRTSKRLADNDPTGRINAVNLKNALGQIEADCGNLHDGWLPFARECLIAFTPWQLDAVSGSHPPHLSGGKPENMCSRRVFPTHFGHWP